MVESGRLSLRAVLASVVGMEKPIVMDFASGKFVIGGVEYAKFGDIPDRLLYARGRNDWSEWAVWRFEATDAALSEMSK